MFTTPQDMKTLKMTAVQHKIQIIKINSGAALSTS